MIEIAHLVLYWDMQPAPLDEAAAIWNAAAFIDIDYV